MFKSALFCVGKKALGENGCERHVGPIHFFMGVKMSGLKVPLSIDEWDAVPEFATANVVFVTGFYRFLGRVSVTELPNSYMRHPGTVVYPTTKNLELKLSFEDDSTLKCSLALGYRKERKNEEALMALFEQWQWR